MLIRRNQKILQHLKMMKKLLQFLDTSTCQCTRCRSRESCCSDAGALIPCQKPTDEGTETESNGVQDLPHIHL